MARWSRRRVFTRLSSASAFPNDGLCDRDARCGASVGEVKVSSFFALDEADRAISDLHVCFVVQRDADRKAGRAIVPNDLNAADGLAARRMSNGL
jgi:hypothetical protein